MQTPTRAASHDENHDRLGFGAQTPLKQKQEAAAADKATGANPLQPANRCCGCLLKCHTAQPSLYPQILDSCREPSSVHPVSQTGAGLAVQPADALKTPACNVEPRNLSGLRKAEGGIQAAAGACHDTAMPLRTDPDDVSWGTEECRSQWKQTYREFLSKQRGHVRVGDVICAQSADFGKLYIQVGAML